MTKFLFVCWTRLVLETIVRRGDCLPTRMSYSGDGFAALRRAGVKFDEPVNTRKWLMKVKFPDGWKVEMSFGNRVAFVLDENGDFKMNIIVATWDHEMFPRLGISSHRV